MAKHSVTNIADGPRILNSMPPVTVQPGQTVEAEVSDAEIKAFEAFGNFSTDSVVSEPGPLDGSIEDLTAHLATLTDVDAVQKLIDAETAGKSRKGAMTALEARRDELLA